MLGLLAIIVVSTGIIFCRTDTSVEIPEKNKFENQLSKLWEVSLGAIKDKKYLRAEKALLTILHVDDRNARAYNRLGILYAKQGQYMDAIECFEISQSLQPNASSLHNVGLIYFQVGQLDKAKQAFEQAIQLEDDVASRHIAYAKVLEAIGDNKHMIEELDKAVNLDRNPQALRILADALERTGDQGRADKVRRLAAQMLARGNRTRIKQPAKLRI